MDDFELLWPVSRSDALPSFRRLLVHLPAFREVFGDLVQFRLVIDASVVQKELRWRVRSRRDPTARSGLHEAIDSGTVVAFAPTALKQEIEQHIEEIAQDTGIPPSQVHEEWQTFQSRLNFYEPDPGGLWKKCVDPDDLPYKEVREQLGAVAVYTRDSDFQAMRVPAITVNLDLTMRDYARARSIEVAVSLGSGVSLMISWHALIAILKGVGECFRRMPAGLKVALSVAVVLALLHPGCREKIVELLRSVKRQLNDAGSPLAAAVIALGGQYVAAQKTATDALAEIESHVPRTRKRSALACARGICLVGKEPLSIEQIECRMKAEGYISKSRNFRAYLRRVLRSDNRFVEGSAGAWTIQAGRVGPVASTAPTD
jgi:hypothetical protein